MEALLRKDFPAADRPYSQDELRDTRVRILERLNVGNMMVYHRRCNHFYLAKAGGKKETAVKENQELDPACCSTCWKLRKTPNNLRDEASDMVDAYHYNFENKPDNWTRSLINLESTYYKWLYQNFEPREKRRNNNRRRNPSSSFNDDNTSQGDNVSQGDNTSQGDNMSQGDNTSNVDVEQ